MSTASQSFWNVTTPALAQCIVQVANANLDGTGTASQLIAANIGGTRIDWVHFQAIGSTTAGMLRVFVGTTSGPVALVAELPVEAVSQSASVRAWAADWYPSQPTQNQPSPLNLPGAQGALGSLWVTTANAEVFRVSAFGANY